MVLDKQLYDEISEYCKMNNIKTRDFIHEILREAFMVKKYGNAPFAFLKAENKVETKKETPVIVPEIPVQTYKEAENVVKEEVVIETTPVITEKEIVKSQIEDKPKTKKKRRLA